MTSTPPPAWLVGRVAGVSPTLQPVAHALVEAQADVLRHAGALDRETLWRRPGEAASAGFHLFHAAGALDRLFTYARGETLTDAERAHLALEKEGGDASMTAADLVTRFDAAALRALEQLRATPDAELFQPRRVGKAGLPSNVIGLLFHGAEHTTRHVGQFLTTLKIAATVPSNAMGIAPPSAPSSSVSATAPPASDSLPSKINLAEKLSSFGELWSPRVVGELNGQQVKLAKLRGEFLWHHHEREDELFLVVRGRLEMRFRDRTVTLEEGEMIVVPHGVEHLPAAKEETHILLFEPASTLNTGNVRNERTVERPERA